MNQGWLWTEANSIDTYLMIDCFRWLPGVQNIVLGDRSHHLHSHVSKERQETETYPRDTFVP